MTKLRKRIYVTADANADDEGGEDLLAWRSLTSADSGWVGVYQLVEEIEKRDAVEIRRKGARRWFKASVA